MCLAEGQNTVTPVRLKPAAPSSRVKHSTTEPVRSLTYCCFSISTDIFKTINLVQLDLILNSIPKQPCIHKVWKDMMIKVRSIAPLAAEKHV